MTQKLQSLLAAVLAVALFAALPGCSGGRSAPAASPQQAQEEVEAVQGLSISVDGDSGEMTISRPKRMGSRALGREESWSIFVYLCGSDLESSSWLFGGMASDDIEEMCAASQSAQVRFVIQTGGANRWHNSAVNARRQQRFLVEDGRLKEVDSQPRTGMGQSQTLEDFLKWGTENYPAGRMGVVLWDHGGGSITGVCFDELDGDDSLSLREMDAALMSVQTSLSASFEFIGFDACLMGTLETANILASYADYMYASEETEPGSGWDYTAIGSYLAQNPGADGEELGRVVCDSFYRSCQADGCEQGVTLSVIDLNRVDNLLLRYNRFAEGLYQAGEDPEQRAEMVRGIVAAENFGGNNRADGYTNMVDLGGLISACAPYAQGSADALRALEDAVVYSVQGTDHPNASGLSTYYPLRISGSEELSVFEDICVSPYYLSFLDRQGHGSVSEEELEDYDESTWFEGGFWTWLNGYLYDAPSGSYSYQPEENDYWDYLDIFEETGESARITFAEEPQLDEDGIYYFVLDENGLRNAADVYACVSQISPDGEDIIELGETYDIEADWETGYFADYFDGWWLSLPDGQNLATYVSDVTEDYIIYSSPIELNGRDTNLRLRQDWDGTVTVEGAWDGISDSGASSRAVVPIRQGDQIVPLYYSYRIDDGEEGMYEGDPCQVRGRLRIEYDLMDSGDYLYAFNIDDIYGDFCFTDYEMFYVDEDGGVSFY